MMAMPGRYLPFSFTILYSVLLGILLPLGLFAHKGIAVLLTIAGLVAFATSLKKGMPKLSASLITVILVSLTLWGLLSGLWSASPANTLKTLASTVLTGLGAFLFIRSLSTINPAHTRLIEIVFCLGTVAGYLLLLTEFLTDAAITKFLTETVMGNPVLSDNPSHRLKSGLLVAAVVFLPWSFLMYRHFPRYFAILMIVAAVVTLMLSNSATTQFSLLGGLVVYGLGRYVSEKITFLATMAAVLLVFVFAPIVPGALPNPTIKGEVYSKVSNSGIHRVFIWQTTAKQIAENPVLGVGFDGTRMLYGKESVEYLTFLPDVPDRTWSIWTEPIPLHPHSFVLQIWLELGAIGALLSLSLVLGILLKIKGEIGEIQNNLSIVAGVFVTTFLIYLSSLGAWQSWWLSTIALAAGVAFISLDRTSEPSAN